MNMGTLVIVVLGVGLVWRWWEAVSKGIRKDIVMYTLLLIWVVVIMAIRYL